MPETFIDPNHLESIENKKEALATKEFVGHLEDQLFKNDLSGLQYLETLDEIESNIQDYSNSRNVLESLRNEKVKEKLLSAELHSRYYGLLVLVNFHLAREAGFANINDQAISYCEDAVEANEIWSKYVKFEKGDREFTQYLLGTKNYFEGKVDVLKAIVSSMSQGRNRDLLEKLIKGLVDRGYPNYSKDLEG